MERLRSICSANNALDYYNSHHGLTEMERTGWNTWGVSAPRIESVAEHVYATMHLAQGICLAYGTDILERQLSMVGSLRAKGSFDLKKAVMILLNHEADETGTIPDIIAIDDRAKAATEMERIQIADDLFLPFGARGTGIRGLIMEFEERRTLEARFAYLCDKLQSSLQCEHYRRAGFDPDISETTEEFQNLPRVIELRKQGLCSMSEMWRAWWRPLYEGTVFDDILQAAIAKK